MSGLKNPLFFYTKISILKIQSLILFLIISIFAQCVVWIQLNLQFISPKWKDNPYLLLTGIPITWLFLKSTQLGVEAFNGQMWPQRLLSFATGIIIFTLMTHIVFGETMTMKNFICLILSCIIVCVQIFTK